MLTANGKYVVALLASFCCSVVSAEIVMIVPLGLQPGDQYRLAFITNGYRDATSTNIDDYNTFVTSQANQNAALAALATTWRALVSTSAIDARDNTGTNTSTLGVPIFRLDGLTIAPNNASLYDGTIDNLFLDQFGFGATPSYVWTGSSVAGIGVPSNQLGSPTAEHGFTLVTDSSWIFVDSGPIPSLVHGRMYAISSVLTVVPEPSSALLIGVGTCVWSLARLRRKKNS